MEKTEFVATFGGVFEHSPWIAGAVWDLGLTGRHDTAAGLHQPFWEVIRQSGREEKLALLRSHPELAVGVVSDEQLTESSQSEQRGAGLDRCSPEEFSEYQKLNACYREKFGFPFIMAVKGCNRHDILESFRARLENTGDEEFQVAVEQVIRIGRFRIDSLFNQI
jgi:OHCU decarboxylase